LLQAEPPENPLVVAAVVSNAQVLAPVMAVATEQSSPWAKAPALMNRAAGIRRKGVVRMVLWIRRIEI
jgi:hypothetical protein